MKQILSLISIMILASIACSLGAVSVDWEPKDVMTPSPLADKLMPEVSTTPTGAVPAVISSTATPATEVPAGFSGQELRRQYIGTTNPPLLEGWSNGGGATTFDTCDSDMDIRCSFDEEMYGVSYWYRPNVPGLAEEILFFEKFVGYDSEGNANMLVLDVLVGSETGGSQWRFQDCQLDGKPDNEIFALRSIVMDPPSQAWRANHKTGHFEPISTAGVVCEDSSAVD